MRTEEGRQVIGRRSGIHSSDDRCTPTSQLYARRFWRLGGRAFRMEQVAKEDCQGLRVRLEMSGVARTKETKSTRE